MCLFATTARSCASRQAGKKCSRQLLRVARAQQHRPGGRLHCGRISTHSCFFGEGPENQQTTGSAAPVVTQLTCSRSAARCGSRPRSASHGSSHWYSAVSLFVSSPTFPVAALNPLLLHFARILFSRIFQGFFATFGPATCSRGTSAYPASFSRNSWNASGPRVFTAFRPYTEKSRGL